jgi:catechol 2,3-dioxygenase-like lactoylglutathione lyase family enzyme
MIEAGTLYEFPGRRLVLAREPFLPEGEADRRMLRLMLDFADEVASPGAVEAEVGWDDDGKIIHRQLRTPDGERVALYKTPEARVVESIDSDVLGSWLRDLPPANVLTIRGGAYRVDLAPGSVIRLSSARGHHDVPVVAHHGQAAVHGPQGSLLEPPLTVRWLRDDQTFDLEIFWSHWLDGCGAEPLSRWLAACQAQGWRITEDPRRR